MARKSFATELNVWTRPKADEEADWALQLTTDNLDAALRTAKQAASARTISAIYEQGRILVEGKHKTDQIMFWWSESYYDAMETAPQERGHGWSDEYETFVDYEYPGATALVVSDLRSSDVEEPREKRYAIVNCDGCGLELPQNEAHVYTHDVEVGHSSSTYRYGSSSTHRSSRRSSSNSYTSGSSRTSGRKYYKRESLLLCSECLQEREASDTNEFKWTLIKFIVGGLILIGIVTAMASSH